METPHFDLLKRLEFIALDNGAVEAAGVIETFSDRSINVNLIVIFKQQVSRLRIFKAESLDQLELAWTDAELTRFFLLALEDYALIGAIL